MGTENDDQPRVKSMLPHGTDTKTLKLWQEAWAEQGAPTTNRAQRRRAQRVGDHARALKKQKES